MPNADARRELRIKRLRKPYEKFHRCPKRDPEGDQSARSGPGVATESSLQALLEHISDSFRKRSENPHERANRLAIRRLIAA